MTGLLGAIQFLTRVPVRLAVPAAPERTIPWFPVVGALVGLGVGGAMAGLSELVPATVAASLAVLLGVLVTGAFHEDGLADVADAFAGGWTREERLRILTDPRHGSYGVAALSGTILLRVVCLAALTPAAAVAGAVAAHTLGRAAALAVIVSAPPAAPAGLGADASAAAGRRGVVAGVVSGLAIAALATGWWVAPLVAAAAVAAAIVVGLALRKLGGTTGDVLGAVEQVAECAVLVVVSGLAARHGVWWSR